MEVTEEVFVWLEISNITSQHNKKSFSLFKGTIFFCGKGGKRGKTLIDCILKVGSMHGKDVVKIR